jgi:transposase
MDLGTVRAELEAAAHTRYFDDQVAWLAVACSKTAITSLMRISWRTVGHIIARVSAEKLAAADPLAGLRRIGIDEISYERGHKYVSVTWNHLARRHLSYLESSGAAAA